MKRESEQMTAMRDARGALLLTHPFFGVLSLKLDLIEDSTIKTACVNSKALRFSPKYVETLSRAALKGLVAHEVMHLALLHHARTGNRESELWNQACDFAINPILISEGFTLPTGALDDARFHGMSAESIYEKLRDEREQNPQGGGDSSPDQNQSSSQGDAGEDDSQSGEGDAGDGTPGGSGNPCGSFEQAGPDGSSEAGEAERQWAENVAEAARAASSAGKLPESMRRHIKEALEPKADWRALLRRFMADQVRARSTWSKPNKRFPDVYLPGRVADGMGGIVVAVDTSGSIDQAALDRFAAEINAIAADVEPAEIRVVYCDSQVNRVDSFETGEPVTLTPCGGGGTAFQPVFDYVESESIRPSCLVYLTDTYGASPVEPDYPVLWATYAANGRVMPWGETVPVD